MLYLVSGNIKDRKEYINNIIVDNAGDPSKATRISTDDLSDERPLSDIVVTQSGLFGGKDFFILTDMARDLPLRDFLEGYSQSSNLIIFSEASVTKKIIGEFQRVESVHKECTPEQKETKSPFNIFALADHLGKRDKKNLWLSYHKALASASVEEINGIFLWQIKNMIQVAVSSQLPEGMKPFVYQKNQGFARNYSLDELRSLMGELTKSFHGRDIYDTLEIQVEKIILSL